MYEPSNSFRFSVFVIAGVALGFVFLVLGGLIFGVDYWWRGRPEHSLNQIGVAVRTHNLNLFRKHVDIKAVSGRLIDDFTSASTNSTAAQQSGQTLGQAFVGLLKSRVVEALEEQIERYVETGNLSADQPDATKSVTADLKEITERLGSFDWATIDGNVATTTISLVPKSKNEKAVILHLKLRRTEDGFWQLMEISLPQEILDQMQKRSR